MEIKTANEYWNAVNLHLLQDFTGQEVRKQINALVTPGIATEDLITKIINLPFPKELGLVDSQDYDHTCAMIIKGLHKVITDNGEIPKPLPANAPKVATKVTKGIMSWLEGGSSRAKDAADIIYEEKSVQARKETVALNSTEGCRKALAEYFGDNPNEADPKVWKRTGKFTQSDKIFRTFICKDTGNEATVCFDPAYDEDPEDAISCFKGAIKPSGSLTTFPEVYGKYWSGKVHFSINAAEDSELSFYCGPESNEGGLDDMDDPGISKVLETIFKDQDIELGAAENYHIIKPKAGQTLEELEKLVIERVTTAGATQSLIADMDM